MNTNLIDKLWENTTLIPRTKCWVYSTGKHNRIVINRKRYIVIRLSLVIYHKLNYKDSWLACHVDELCKNKTCWNPAHLYKGNNSTNQLDVVKAGKHWEASRNFCKRGHEFTPENTYMSKRENRRRCRKCIKLHNDSRENTHV